MNLDLSVKIDDDAYPNSTIDTSTESSSIQTEIFFYLFLFVDIPAVLCSMLLFYYFIRLPELRHQHYTNQMIIYVLICTFLLDVVDIPLMLPYLRNYHYIASMRNPQSFCLFWLMYDYIIYIACLWFIALLSLERYLVIFFKQIVSKNKRRRFFLYYVTAASIVVSIFSWYTYMFVFYPCAQIYFDYTQTFCGHPCYQIEASATLFNFEWILFGLLPVFLTVLFTLILILHVLHQRRKISRHLTQRETWKRTRKMFVQLLPITFIFLLFTMPVTIVGLLSVSNPWYATTPYLYTTHLAYGLPLMTPFAVLSNQKVIQKHLFALFKPRRLNRTAPATIRGRPIQQVDTRTTVKVTPKPVFIAHVD